MLTGKNDRALYYKKVDKDFYFFYQRWQELLDSRTLDMHQYNILNTCVACNELADVIEKTLQGLLIARQNVDDVKSEALEILKQDDVLEKHNMPLRNILMRILSSRTNVKSRGEDADDKNSSFFISLKRLKFQLKAQVRALSGTYMSYLLEELKLDIYNEDYILIEKHMEMVISQCIYNGWSSKGLLAIISCFEGEKSFEEKWNNFLQSINAGNDNKFEVYYSIKIETRNDITADNVREVIRSLGLNLKKVKILSIMMQLDVTYILRLILAQAILLLK